MCLFDLYAFIIVLRGGAECSIVTICSDLVGHVNGNN